MLFKLAATNWIEKLEKYNRWNNVDRDPNVTALVEAKIINISTTYQVLSELTAFVGVLKNKNSGEIQNMEPAQKTDIGPMAPQLNDFDGPGMMEN
jgi:hypothetical protein